MPNQSFADLRPQDSPVLGARLAGRSPLRSLAMLTALNEQITVLVAGTGKVSASHPDQHIFASLPRSGTVRAATLLAEVGDCRQGFPTDDALAALAGSCPSTRQSDKRGQAVFRW